MQPLSNETSTLIVRVTKVGGREYWRSDKVIHLDYPYAERQMRGTQHESGQYKVNQVLITCT